MYNDIFAITSVIQDTGLSKTLPFPGPLLGAPRRMELGPVGSITTGNTGRGQDNDLSSILTLVQMSGQLRPSALHTSALNHLATFKALSGRCLLLCNPRKTELDRIIFSLEALIFLHFVLVRRQTKIQNFSFFFFFFQNAKFQNLYLELTITLFNTSKKNKVFCFKILSLLIPFCNPKA